MYVINNTKGIGEVIEVLDNKYVVYFEEVDEEKTLLKDFTKVYDTLEDAEKALNPEITEQMVDEILTKVEEDKVQAIEARKYSQWLEEHNAEVSKKLMQNI